MINTKFKSYIYIFIVILFLSQSILEIYFNRFSYFDEVFVIFSLIAILFLHINKPFDSSDIGFISIVMLFVLCGLISNFLSGVLRSPYAIVMDVFSNLKFFIVFYLSCNLCFNRQQMFNVLDSFAFLSRVLILILAILSIVSQFVNIGLTDDIRYGVRSFKFLYENPAGFNTNYYFVICLFSISLFNNQLKLRKYSNIFAIISIIPWILSMRTRAFAFAIIFIFLYFFLITRRKIFKLKIRYFVLIAVICVFVGYDSFLKYFVLNDNQVRYNMMNTSFQIFRDYFPFGTGFATFGTEMSRVFYSDVYYLYGINNIWGLSPTEPLFILDQYWFAVIGQFGLIGTLEIGLLLFIVYCNLWKKADIKYLQLGVLMFAITSLVSSLTAASYIQGSTIGCCFVISSICNYNFKKEGILYARIKNCCSSCNLQ